MKLNNQMLRSRSVGPLNAVEYLDLSELGLVSLGRLVSCPKLTSLILRGNHLQSIGGLESCQQLWHIDLSNNQLVSVEGLSRFLSLGTLVLSNNQLTWASLTHLRHLHILTLSLQGNPQLEKDPYYRIHVIDCLPNVWMLDGRIVTSAERIQVRQFFHDSGLTDTPVRRKLKKDSFVPSTLKKIEIDGIFGEKAIHMMRTFPKNAVLNVETDWKRLQYLAQSLQADISLEWQYSARKPGGVDTTTQRPSFVTDMFTARLTDRERCNMVLLMLVASLHFVLPTHLVRDTLDTGKLTTVGSVQTMDLFLLPRLLRCKVVSLLVSAVKVDREQNEDGGLYTKLYLCLYHMVSELTKLSESTSANQTSPATKLASQLEDYKRLLATEVVQLMCIVPSFFDYLDRDIGVINLVRIATADPDINEKMIQISKTKGDDERSQKIVLRQMADFLLMKVQEQLQNLTNKSTFLSACDRILAKSDALPMKGENTPLYKADYLVRGVNSPDDDPPAVNPRKTSAKARTKFPHLGDKMLLGPQTIGKIISLPQPTMALVIIDAVPVASGAVEHKLKEADNHYTYVNVEQLEWDGTHNLWKPKGTIGDKFTLQAAEDFNREAVSRGLEDDSYRPCTPEAGPLSDQKAIQAPAPLFFSNTPRQHVFVPTDRTAHKPKTRRPQRPLSSVYKERLKLTLDLSRRAQSAGSRRPLAVTYGSKASTPKNPKVSMLQLGHVSGMRIQRKGTGRQGKEEGGGWLDSSRRGSSEVTPSSTTAYPSLLTSSMITGTERSVVNDASDVESERVFPAAQSTPKDRSRDEGGGKENEAPADNDGAVPDVKVSPDTGDTKPEPSPEKQQDETLSGEKDSSLPEEARKTTEKSSELKPEKKPKLTTRSDSSLLARDRPALDAALKDRAEDQTKDVFLTSVSEATHNVGRFYSGTQLGGRSRPVSALERQGVMVGGRAPENIFDSEFQQQRIDAWKQKTRPATAKVLQSTNAPPPPQPPSSPIPQPSAAADLLHQDQAHPQPFPPPPPLSHSPSLDTLSVASVPRGDVATIIRHRMPRANLWLGGGRDLFWEDLKARPKSGHTPGWKEGLPDSMMKPRPRSAAARLHRRTKTPTLYSPTCKEAFLMNDLVDFPDSAHHMTSVAPTSHTRRFHHYSPHRGVYDEDPLPGPMPESVYRRIPGLSLHADTRVAAKHGRGIALSAPSPYSRTSDQSPTLAAISTTTTSPPTPACPACMKTICRTATKTHYVHVLTPSTPQCASHLHVVQARELPLSLKKENFRVLGSAFLA